MTSAPSPVSDASARHVVSLIVAGLAVATLLESAFAAPQQRAIPATSGYPVFRDAARAAGLDFIHLSGASEEKFLPEIVGSGGLFFDFDGDGWVDIFLVDGGSWADVTVAGRAKHRLYRNVGRGHFEDVTAKSGIRHRGYGMGACAGDINNDGLIDLYITNVGANALYRNVGSGRFTEIPGAGGAGAAAWSTSCAFVDIDRDGAIDLFVTNYVEANRATNKFCGIKGPPVVRDYCHPLIHQPLTNILYRNSGRGAFEDISTRSGIAGHRGNGLGVAVADVDDDGWPDVFVANDAMPNFLFHNKGNGTFSDIAGLAGVAVAVDGKARAGMGTAFGDFAGNGRPGLIVTNHEAEMHSLFLNLGNRLFSDVTTRSGIGPATRPYVGFGVVFLDYDNDTRLDVAVANGHVVANAAVIKAGGRYAQRNLLLRNTGERFVDMTKEAGPGFALEMVSRGLAAADVDNDGDLDLLITNNGSRPNLLMNDGGDQNAMLVRVIGTTSNRSGIGAKVVLTAGTVRQTRDVQSGSSYLAQNDLRAHFGLGAAARVDRLEVHWPGGTTDVAEHIPANHIITLRQGQGVVNRTPFVR